MALQFYHNFISNWTLVQHMVFAKDKNKETPGRELTMKRFDFDNEITHSEDQILQG